MSRITMSGCMERRVGDEIDGAVGYFCLAVVACCFVLLFRFVVYISVLFSFFA